MFAYLLKLFGIHRSELHSFTYAWVLKMLLRSSITLGWTAVIAIFVTQFSISSLPFLFFFQAILAILGMVIYSMYLNFSSKNLIIFNTFVSAVLLFFSLFFLDFTQFFFLILFLIFGIFLTQAQLLLSNFLEDFFTPSNGERLFPLVESAETFGIVLGGTLVAFLGSHFAYYKIFYVVVLFLVFFTAFLYFFEPKLKFHSEDDEKKENSQSHKRVSFSFDDRVKKIFKIPFLRGILLLTFTQAIIGQIFEFNFTQAVDLSSSSSHESSHVAHLLAGLGIFHIISAILAFIVQFFIARKILKSLGTVGSFLLHSLVTLLSSLSMLLGANYFTSALAKINFELTGIINKSAYENFYYVLHAGTQKFVREFLEAFILPLGSLIGAFVLLFSQGFLGSQKVLFLHTFFLIVLSAFFVFVSIKLQKYYTRLSEDILFRTKDHTSHFNAIEILAQKGHHKAVQLLSRYLAQENLSLPLKVKALEALGSIPDLEAISLLSKYLKQKNADIVLIVLQTMRSWFYNHKKLLKNSLLYAEIIHLLKKFLKSTKSEKNKVLIVDCLAVFDDPSLFYYLKSYLDSPSSEIRISIILALWKFDPYKGALKKLFEKSFRSHRQSDMLVLLRVLAELQLKEYEVKILSLLKSSNLKIRLYAIMALLRLDYHSSLSFLGDLLFNGNRVLLEEFEKILKCLNRKYFKQLQNFFVREIFSSKNKYSHYPLRKLQNIARLMEIHQNL